MQLKKTAGSSEMYIASFSYFSRIYVKNKVMYLNESQFLDAVA
jgi:hypothetical protein